jgi:glycosyltransferase involved in cell wall biosynthesis
MEKMPPISLILLAYNEAQTIEKEVNLFYDKIIAKIPGSEFIVSEDGSIDGTSEILQRLSAEGKIIHLTSTVRKGYKKALIDAVLSARNNFIFFSDSGLKHNPDDFWNLYTHVDCCDLIVGKKTNRKDQLYRRFLTASYNFFIRKYFRIENVHDADSGFKLFNANVVKSVFRRPLLFSDLISSEIVIRTVYSNLTYMEVDVEYEGREGESRGLPLKRVPKVIVKVLRDIRLLKKELVENKPVIEAQ